MSALGCCVDKKYGKGCNDATCMALPSGKTCGDCASVARCLAFGFTRGREQTSCDFFPRRFLPVIGVPGVPPGETAGPGVAPGGTATNA